MTERQFRLELNKVRSKALARLNKAIGNIDDAEDMLQLAIIKAWRNRNEIEGKFSTYFFHIISSSIADWVRRPRIGKLTVQGSPLTIDSFECPEAKASFQACEYDALVDRFSDTMKDKLAGKLVREIAKERGTTAVAVKCALRRERIHLQEKYKDFFN